MSKKGQLLWEKAKTIIPGGNQLLSKRSELFLPELWPAYYKKAKGCEVWDLDDNKYYDFAGMGVTACILGYADDDVDNAVKEAINNGSMSTLNSYEEVELAEKLIELHPWSDMVRFARTGGEACAIAVRIARAASGKDHVAFCGYHGWHDWYLSANISNESNLNAQLLPGLETKGVPDELRGTSHPFYYNDYASFENVIAEFGDKIGTIIMEPQRGNRPKNNFLQKIRGVASKHNIVLIYDEVTSGFHDNFGGIHLSLDVNPDIAIFAKALGNGYAISAVIGKQEVMDIAQDTFISSTMWTERLGFVAGLASIKKMEKYHVQEKLKLYGLKIKQGWEKAANDANLDISLSGIDSIPYFSFDYKNKTELLTYFNQEMLKRGCLTNGGTATTFAYTDKIIDEYLENVTDVFNKISYLDNNIEQHLQGQVKHTTFARLTD
jgi:glutamate-1-semialdehyde 2,1-aminomutase